MNSGKIKIDKDDKQNTITYSYSYKLLYYNNFFWDWHSFTNIKLELSNKDTTPLISPLTFKIFETFNINSQVTWDREQVHSTCSSQNTDDIGLGLHSRPRKGYKCEEDLQQHVRNVHPALPDYE